MRIKWVRPRKDDDPLHLGGNAEISNLSPEFDLERWDGELRPIIGREQDSFKVTFNPILDFYLDANKLLKSEFDAALKVQYTIAKQDGVDLECYSNLSLINNIHAIEEEHQSFIAFDWINVPIELNAGIGRGLTPSTNDWTAKAIIGVEL